MKTCYTCNEHKDPPMFRDGRRTCKLCENKIRYQKKKEKRKNDSSYDEKLKKYDVIRKRRKEKNPIHGTIQSLRSHLRKIRNDRGYIKSGSLSKIIGIEWNEFKIYFESKFSPGMNWDNHGHGVGKWALQHIIPKTYAETEDDIYRLNYYKNLMPMDFSDNGSLKDRILRYQLNEWHYDNCSDFLDKHKDRILDSINEIYK